MVRNKSASLGFLSSLAASLCCIAPLVATLGGVSGVASSFSWIEPIRPYLMGSSVLLLGVAWFKGQRSPKRDDCGCEIHGKRILLQSNRFLAVVTILAILLMTFPSYAHLFYTQKKPAEIVATTPTASLKKVEFFVKGMGCASCEPEVESAVEKLAGIQNVKASAINKNTIVQFDPTKTNIEAIRNATKSTGYTVQNVKP